eukprot:UN11272
MYPVGATVGTKLFYELGFSTSGAVASVLFYIPFLRRFISYMGGFPATRNNILTVCKKAKPSTIIFFSVGGISEMFLGIDDFEEIIINNR